VVELPLPHPSLALVPTMRAAKRTHDDVTSEADSTSASEPSDTADSEMLARVAAAKRLHQEHMDDFINKRIRLGELALDITAANTERDERVANQRFRKAEAEAMHAEVLERVSAAWVDAARVSKDLPVSETLLPHAEWAVRILREVKADLSVGAMEEFDEIPGSSEFKRVVLSSERFARAAVTFAERVSESIVSAAMAHVTPSTIVEKSFLLFARKILTSE
jgi:hypothetical protein